jgi:geranylgeranyl reductase family protein
MEAVDVLIIGAGPAGSTAALMLARGGMGVLLVDRHAFPRPKVCGDALASDAIEVLKEIGLYSAVEKAGYSVSRCRVFAPNGDSMSLKGEFIMIRRILFDDILCRAAVDAGARTMWNLSFESCSLNDARYTAQFRDKKKRKHSVSARYIILATGANPLPLKELALLQRFEPSAIAARRYVTTAKGPAQEPIFSYEDFLLPGYGWIFPVEKGIYNVGCCLFPEAARQGITLHDLYHRFITNSPIAKELLSNPQEQTPLRGAPLRAGFSGSLPGRDSMLVVGEALGLTYPGTGEGIGKSMKSGQLAAKAILEGHNTNNEVQPIELYCRFLEEIRDQYKPYIIGQKWMKHPSVVNLIVERANKSETVKKLLEGIITEEVQPTTVLSMRGLAKMIFGLTQINKLKVNLEDKLAQKGLGGLKEIARK